MIATQQKSETELLAARQIIASALASALADPRAPVAQRANGADLGVIAHAWAEIVCNSEALQADSLGLGERLPQNVTATALAHWLSLPVSRREIVHQRIFGLVMTKLCPAYETEYCAWNDTTHRSQELADIAGFYRAFGLGPSRSAPERFDHVSLEVEFVSMLLEKERWATENAEEEHLEVCRNARSAFLRDHASWWLPTFGRLLEKRANLLSETGSTTAAELRLVAGVAQTLCAWIAAERHFANVMPTRRIVSPNITPQDATDDCGTCSSCTHEPSHV